MTFQPAAMVYTQSFGSRPENVEVPTIQTRPPTSQDVNFPIGKRWIDTAGGNEYVLVSQSSAGGVLSSTWSEGGNAYATTTTPGIVTLSSSVTTDSASTTKVPYAKAVYDYGQSLVLAGASIAQTGVT